jgi:hypothetical protein
MLNHRVAEHKVERLIGKWQVCTVAVDKLDTGGGGRIGTPRHVQQDEPRADGTEQPEIDRAADVEDPPFRADGESCQQPRHSLPPKSLPNLQDHAQKWHI